MDLYLQQLRLAEGILFDYNGTLSDDERILEEAYETALVDMGLGGLALGEYDSLVGLSDPDIAERILLKRGSKDIDEMIRRLSSAYASAIEHRPTIPSLTVQFVQRLRFEGKEVAVVTGTFRKLMQRGLDAAGLSELGNRSVAIEDVHAGKPDPEGFLLGARKIGVELEKIVGFEDSRAGVEALCAAGIKAVGIGPHLRNEDGLLAHFETMDHAAQAYMH